jgi:hypothetical protein
VDPALVHGQPQRLWPVRGEGLLWSENVNLINYIRF